MPVNPFALNAGLQQTQNLFGLALQFQQLQDQAGQRKESRDIAQQRLKLDQDQFKLLKMNQEREEKMIEQKNQQLQSSLEPLLREFGGGALAEQLAEPLRASGVESGGQRLLSGQTIPLQTGGTATVGDIQGPGGGTEAQRAELEATAPQRAQLETAQRLLSAGEPALASRLVERAIGPEPLTQAQFLDAQYKQVQSELAQRKEARTALEFQQKESRLGREFTAEERRQREEFSKKYDLDERRLEQAERKLEAELKKPRYSKDVEEIALANYGQTFSELDQKEQRDVLKKEFDRQVAISSRQGTDKPLEGVAATKVNAINALITSSDDLANIENKDYTGPVKSTLGRIRVLTGRAKDDEIVFRQLAKDIQLSLTYFKTGFAATPSEVKNLAEVAPTANDTADEFRVKLREFRKRLRLFRRDTVITATTPASKLEETLKNAPDISVPKTPLQQRLEAEEAARQGAQQTAPSPGQQPSQTLQTIFPELRRQ